MKVKNPILAAMLTKLGVEVKAELIIDDSNGTSLTFPEISDVSEIAEGVAVSAPDGTYVIADGDNAITIVVASGVITSVTIDEPVAAAEETLDADVEAVLEAQTEEIVSLKSEVSALKADLAQLKVSLKHDDGKGAAAAAAGSTKVKFRAV
jgi:hypothetical protein